MPTKYYKTSTPRVKLYASGGRSIRFETADGVVGRFATEDESLQKSLDEFIRKKVGGGIAEIAEAEFRDLEGKAKGRRFQPEREYLGDKGPVPAVVPLPPAVPAADKPAPAPAAAEPVTTPQTSEPAVTPSTAPTVRRRGRPPGRSADGAPPSA